MVTGSTVSDFGEIETCNLALAAALILSGGELNRNNFDDSDRRHVKLYVMGDLDALRQVERDFYAYRYFADVRKFADIFKDVKSFLHSLGG